MTKNLKHVSIGLLILGMASSVFALNEKQIRTEIQKRLGTSANVRNVTPSPIPGLFEVQVNNEIFYTDSNAKYLIQGEMVELASGNNLTTKRQEDINRIKWSELPQAQAFKVVRGNGSRQIAVFSDPNCGYCKRLEKTLQQLDNVTIYNYLIPILSADSALKSKQIWCAADQQKIPLERLDNDRWRLPKNSASCEIITTVYAFDQSVRTAYLDQERGFFNPTSLCLAVQGQAHLPCSLAIAPPTDQSLLGWNAHCTLAPVKTDLQGFGFYLAKNYDDLIDHPVAMGHFDLIEWQLYGTPHAMAIQGLTAEQSELLDKEQLARDLSKICAETIRLFEPRKPKAPFSRYLFIVNAALDGYGGLEHHNSTALLCKRDQLPYQDHDAKTPKKTYEEFLGLCSHEYFHAWLVKRIQPKAFQPLDDLMRYLWKEHGKPFLGINQYSLDLAISQIMGITFNKIWQDFKKNYINGTQDLPLQLWLPQIAEISVSLKSARFLDDLKLSLGIRHADSHGWLKLTHVLDGGLAQQAGLAPHDLISSINGQRVNSSRLDPVLASLKRSKRLSFHYFRQDKECNASIALKLNSPVQYEIKTNKSNSF